MLSISETTLFLRLRGKKKMNTKVIRGKRPLFCEKIVKKLRQYSYEYSSRMPQNEEMNPEDMMLLEKAAALNVRRGIFLKNFA